MLSRGQSGACPSSIYSRVFLLWQYPMLTSLKLLLMRKNLTGAWFKVGASKNLSVLSQKAKITQLNTPQFILTQFFTLSLSNHNNTLLLHCIIRTKKSKVSLKIPEISLAWFLILNHIWCVSSVKERSKCTCQLWKV